MIEGRTVNDVMKDVIPAIIGLNISILVSLLIPFHQGNNSDKYNL